MGLAELTSEAVQAAIAEFNQLGRQTFLDKYGFNRSQAYWLDFNGQLYDSKAIAGAAHGYLPGQDPLAAADFSGGAATVQKQLRELGFDVVYLQPEWKRPELLQALKLYVEVDALEGKPIPSETDPRVVALSRTLRQQAAAGARTLPQGFRSTGSVRQKLANFHSCERDVAIERGVPGAERWPAGSSHTARADRDLIKEFWGRWDSIDDELARGVREDGVRL